MDIRNLVKNIFSRKNSVKISEIAIDSAISSAYYGSLALEIAKNIIANAVAKCDFRFFYKSAENPKSKEYYRWNIRPNINQSGAEFKKQLISQLIDDNEVLVVEINNDLFIADSFLTPAHNIGTKEIVFQNVIVNSVCVYQNLKRSDCFYFRLNNENIKSIVAGVTSNLTTVLDYAINGYKNANSSKWKYKIDGLSIEQADFSEKMQEIKQKQLEPFLNAQNAVMPEFNGNEISNISSTVAKTSNNIVDLQKAIFSVVANAFHIPINLMLGGAVDDKTEIRFINDCIEPILLLISNEISRGFFDFKNFVDGCKCDIDSSAISVTLISTIANGIEKLLSSGVMNIDEIRENILHITRLNTDFSTKYWITKNFEEIEKALEERGDNVE